ncbi:MAG: AAA family ATPase [Comamonas sp.]|nr:AAA family ATPase [Comamonas sp.]
MIAMKAKINRLPTGVPGLDEVLGGGLPEFSFNLIAGPPGCGKTTLAHQIMFSLSTPERPALYFTMLGEPPLKMLRYQQQFDFFDLDKLNRSIRFINLADEFKIGNLDRVLERIAAEVEERTPGLVFIESFSAMAVQGQSMSRPPVDIQQFSHDLSVLLTSWQVTTFLIGEYFSGAVPNPVFTVCDGLIWLQQSVERNSMVRKMEVVKMRGQPTLPGLHSFRISDAGLHVFAPAQLSVPAAPAPVSTAAQGERLRLGVARLDEMLGGGLPVGYSLLIAGPSGSGKSILAASFLAEGARLGETAVIAAFEQRPDRARGAGIAELVAADRIGVIETWAPALSVDEIAMLLITEIRRLRASRVVIDSLSGFVLALAPTFREEFRQSLLRLVSALASTGVTLLMTSELEDRFDELSFSPYGTAFLTDAIIVQRYIEVESRLRRLMAVVKVRNSMHSNELCLFHIDDHGIQVDEMVADYEGLLGGRPRLRQGVPGNGDGTTVPTSEG